MHEVDPDLTPVQGPPRASPHQANNVVRFLQEGYQVGPGIIRGVWWGIPQVSPVQPVPGLPMGSQGPRRQFRVALGSVDPLEELYPVAVPLPRHP